MQLPQPLQSHHGGAAGRSRSSPLRFWFSPTMHMSYFRALLCTEGCTQLTSSMCRKALTRSPESRCAYSPYGSYEITVHGALAENSDLVHPCYLQSHLR